MPIARTTPTPMQWCVTATLDTRIPVLPRMWSAKVCHPTVHMLFRVITLLLDALLRSQIAVWSTTEDAMSMPFARMIPATMPSFVLAKQDTPTPAQQPTSLVPVRSSFHSSLPFIQLSFFLSRITVDTCLVNNGGCDVNAICSHESNTNAVKCSCKTGYTFAGTGSNLVCTGN